MVQCSPDLETSADRFRRGILVSSRSLECVTYEANEYCTHGTVARGPRGVAGSGCSNVRGFARRHCSDGTREGGNRPNGHSCAWPARWTGRRTSRHAKVFPKNEGHCGHWPSGGIRESKRPSSPLGIGDRATRLAGVPHQSNPSFARMHKAEPYATGATKDQWFAAFRAGISVTRVVFCPTHPRYQLQYFQV